MADNWTGNSQNVSDGAPNNPIRTTEWVGDTLNTHRGSLSSTSMRYHELALQRWLNGIFLLRWGAPVPVVFTSPMDAFSLFSKLWSEANNPFQYLLDVKDDKGVPCYQPYPAPVRYPVMSVYRKGWKFRNFQNFSIHRMRWINWPTVSDAAQLNDAGTHQQGTEMTRCNLGEVTTSRYPMAFDYRFQIDHFCNRPDTQAFFLSQLFREFWRTGGPTLQTWIKVKYPGSWGDKLVRLYIDGDIENLTPEEPEDGKNVEYRTSFTVVLEGYDIDLNFEIYPALWKVIFREGSAVSPAEVTEAFDLREHPESSIIDYREKTTVMPPPGTCAVNLRTLRDEAMQVHEIQLTTLTVTGTGPLGFPGYPPKAGAEDFGLFSIAVLPPPPPMEISGTESGGFLGGFFFGSHAGTDVVVDAGSYSDSGSNQWSFLVGSMDLYVIPESAAESGGFRTGTYFSVSLDGGTYSETGSNASAFSVGTYADTIVAVVAGTEFGTIVLGFGTGTYADVVVDGGSYYESGTASHAFSVGTHAQLILSAGTYFESGSFVAGFYSGTYL